MYNNFGMYLLSNRIINQSLIWYFLGHYDLHAPCFTHTFVRPKIKYFILNKKKLNQMKTTIKPRLAVFLTAYCLLPTISFAQSPNWQWAKSVGGMGDNKATSVAVDVSGNSYVAGTFNSFSLVFGSTILTNAGNSTYDMFLAKYDVNGNVLWAKRAGGLGSDAAYSLAVDASGNTYLAGSFSSSTLAFGSTTLTNVGSYDIFLAKYDVNGNVLWAKNAGGTSSDGALSVAVDASGNTYLAGSFTSSTLAFSSTTLTNANVGWDDIFLAKYDVNGNVLWAKNAGGMGGDMAYSVSVDVSGNIYLTGGFASPTLAFGSTTLTNSGSTDMFLAKYDANGTVLWAKSTGGTTDDYAFSVSVDVSGNTYLAGSFNSLSIVFGSTALTNADNTGNTNDMFFVKYDATGTILWAKSAGGTNLDEAFSVAVDASGNIYVAGGFYSPTLAFGSTTLTNAGSSSVFIAKSGGVTGINELSNPLNISVFPNPFTTQTTFSFSTDTSALLSMTNASLLIYDLVGKEVIRNIIPSGTRDLIVKREGLSSGMYFYQILSEEKYISNGKLVVND